MRKSSQRKPKGAYHHGDLERALVEAAVRTIREDGIQALTLRSVGARLGVSRTALYRHFDDKAALVARLATEGFRLLHAALAAGMERAAASRTDTFQEMAGAYARFALHNPAYYQTMFGGFLTDWSGYPELMQQADASFSLLAGAVRAEQRRGRLVRGNPIEIAEIGWALMHGIATLGAARRLERTATGVEALAIMGSKLFQSGLRRTPRPAAMKNTKKAKSKNKSG